MKKQLATIFGSLLIVNQSGAASAEPVKTAASATSAMSAAAAAAPVKSAAASAAAGQTSLSRSPERKEQIVDLLMSAEDYFASGDYEKAGKQYSKIINLAPGNAEGYLGAGRIRVLRGDRKQALIYFEKATKLSPQSAEAHFELGSNQLVLGKLQDAVRELALAYDLNPQRPEIQYRLMQARSLNDVSRLTPRSPVARALSLDSAATPGTALIHSPGSGAGASG